MPGRTDADTNVENIEKDRRRNPRFSCGGHAKIMRLPSNGIFLPGKIIDLSLGGCYVDTALPIDCGVRAEIMVHVNAASFRAIGEVKAIRGRSGASIEFVRLSSGGKDMLADLIAELARLQAVMNKLKSAHREVDAESFREELVDGNLQPMMRSPRFSFRGTILSAETSQPSTASSVKNDRIIEAQPLVITVDLFG
jgi:hypothetical protein